MITFSIKNGTRTDCLILNVYRLLEGRDVFAVMPTGIACREVLE
jgi:hypothetical protein